MSIKINQISIQNFKLFKNLVIDFENPTLTVLDGPNGFGKTSFYDAVEVLFTGKLRRYISLVSDVIDRRTPIEGNPLVCNSADENDELIISAEIELNGISYTIQRKENCSTLKRRNLNDFTLPLYINDELDDGTFFNQQLSVDFDKNFEFLNYIEQEDNIYLLKSKDKDRKAKIAHLFNTEEFQNKIEKLTKLHSKLTPACSTQVKDEYEEIQRKINEYSNIAEIDEVEYLKLFDWKDIIWDKDLLGFENGKYSQWLGDEGEIVKLSKFINNFSEFQKKLDNDKIKKLLDNIAIVKNMILYSNSLENEEVLSSKLLIDKKIVAFSKNFKNGILDAVKNEKTIIYTEIKELAKQVIDIDSYNDDVIRVLELINSSDEFVVILNSIKDSRNIYIQKYTEYHDKNPTGECPLCGYDWEDSDILLSNFKKQEETLTDLLKNTNDNLLIKLDSFEKNYFKPLNEFFSKYREENIIDEQFVDGLHQVKNNENEIIELKEKFESFEIKLDEILNKEEKVVPLEDKIELLKVLVEEKKEVLDNEKLATYFSDYYLNYFMEDSDKVALVTVEQLEEKKKYIEWQYILYQNSELEGLQREFTTKKNNYDNATELRKKIKKLRDIYNNSLNEYQEKLIKDIEILFHIYSGRIMQNYQNGLGLFIKSDNDGIRFIESGTFGTDEVNYNRHDAVFTMSSGQLASLIISFTLALNKRYSKSKLLLIDDPVQTLDELNIAGYVNLLRNEFTDRQIFISTHESMMSAYMRYKFKKFGLNTQRINFKEKYLEEI